MSRLLEWAHARFPSAQVIEPLDDGRVRVVVSFRAPILEPGIPWVVAVSQSAEFIFQEVDHVD